jgi:uncharacterized protein (DUF58 family)
MKLNYTEYHKKAINKISNFDLKVKNIAEGFMIGIHKSPYHGFSVDFSEHRQYYPGDPLKNIDWKIVAKTEKYFVKQYDEETNVNSYIFIDSSNSLNYSSDNKKYFTKIEYVKLLAGAMAYILNKQRDAISLTVYSDKIENFIPQKASNSHYFEILKTIHNIHPGGKSNSYKSLLEIIDNIKKNGLVIVFSDLIETKENVINFIKKIKSKKNDIILFQILDPEEINFDFGADKLFLDLETNEKMHTTPLQIQKDYKELVQKYLNDIKNEVAKYDIDYELITTSTPFDVALLTFFKKRAKLQ